jgi:excisionase family DNA binding protein
VFTITEAAKKAGVSRTAIYKAIKAGRLSATKDDNGNFQIDAAELRI